MDVCTICHEPADAGERMPGGGSLCPPCALLFRWFLSYYAEVEFASEERGTTPETTFHELSVESLDYVQWLLEAEERFAVTIPDRQAERMRSVGDDLRFIRLHMKAAGKEQMLGDRGPLWDQGLDG